MLYSIITEYTPPTANTPTHPTLCTIFFRQLGLLRKRSQQPSAVKAANYQEFGYVIVLDFESTCWEGQKYRSQEIIEFPCVLINTASGKVESEFQIYVQPQENPTLSEFCRGLTGITQNQVDEGIPIALCLKKFTRWLEGVKKEFGLVFDSESSTRSNGGQRCTFITWSDWDLGICLHYECQRKSLKRPPELSSWIDLRATYRRFYDRKPAGLEGALKDVGIEFSGRQHSGLDDARNTAKLAYRMITDGCILKTTKSLKASSSGSATSDLATTKTLHKRDRTLVASSPKVDKNKTSKICDPTCTPLSKRVCATSTPKGRRTNVNTCKNSTAVSSVNNKDIAKKLPLSDISNIESVDNIEKDDLEFDNIQWSPWKMISPRKSVHKGETLPSKGKSIASVTTKCDVSNMSSNAIDSTSDMLSTTISSNTMRSGKYSRNGHLQSYNKTPAKPYNSNTLSTSRDKTPISQSITKYFKVYKSPSNISSKKPNNRASDDLNVSSISSENSFTSNGKLNTCNATLCGDNKMSLMSNTNNNLSNNLLNTSPMLTKEQNVPKSRNGFSNNSSYVSTDSYNSPRMSLINTPDNSFNSSNATCDKTSPSNSSNSSFLAHTKKKSINMIAASKTHSCITLNTSLTTTITNNTSQSYKTSPTNTVLTMNTSFRTPTNKTLNTSSTYTTPTNTSINTSFKTPTNHSYNTTLNTSNSYKTPNTTMLVTPPFCKCGKRAKRKIAQTPGPNQGRAFFACTKSRSSFGAKKSGCEFFKWDKSGDLNDSVCDVSMRRKTLGTSCRM